MNKTKPIVLINIINNEFNKKDLDIIHKFGLPLLKKKNTKNEFYLCIIETINKKKINNLHDIQKYFNEPINTLKFAVDKNIKLCINSAKTNLSITYIVK